MGQRSASKPIGVIRDYSPGGLLGGDIYVPPAGLLGGAPSFGALTPAEPSYRDTVTDSIRSGLERLGMGRHGAVQNAKGLVGLGEWTPWGALTAADDIKRSYNKGDYLGTGLGLAMFLGPGAKTAKKPMLDLAEEMLAKGATREEIWNATGWFKGADKKWRFEIDDSKSQIGKKALDELTSGPGGAYGATQRTAPGVIQHKELYDAYPDMRNVDVDARFNTRLSSPKGDFVESLGGVGDRPQISVQSNSLNGDPRSVRGITLHEMQHGVQSAEDFARGGNLMVFGHSDPVVRDAVAAEMDKLLRTLSLDEYSAQLRASWPDATDAELAKSYQEYLKANRRARSNVYDPAAKAAQETASMNVYKRMAGEVEARNVQKRMNMTADQRKATPPWLTEDVPLDQQIVRFR